MSDPKYENIGTPVIRLVEECGELLQAIGKGERFGWDNYHPDRAVNNLWELQAEWQDLEKAYMCFINHIQANQTAQLHQTAKKNAAGEL